MYFKKLTLIIFTAIILISVACSKETTITEINDSNALVGSGSIVSKEVLLAQFEEIVLEKNCNVELIRGTEYKASISDYSNLVQYTKLENIGSKLIIKTEPQNIILNNSKAKVIIYLPEQTLKAINILGAGNINFKSQFNDITNIAISGSGNITNEVPSVTKSLNISINGSGSVDVLKTQSQMAICDISGSGNIKLAISDILNATILGSGNIYYQSNNNVTSITSVITGSGKVIKL
ncbi:DUF2807 domain-containing protein [Flavobacterium oreochromis]|uniref:GIN domain-containing protein n=1 Tax=Flavobacterium oreochromis TaxID=2906078 RepID=UPI001CE4E81A|nr:DUF2807 domain-containing protein [Flavobacterium oreochromis]QYS86034.1 DUF2807 domain-containing protein [Flavobacterium oreochromis]